MDASVIPRYGRHVSLCKVSPTVIPETHPSWTAVRVAEVLLVTKRSVTLCHPSHDARGQLLTLHTRIGPTFLVVQEHVHILHTILQHPPSPLYLVEEELGLQATRNLQCSSPIISRDVVCDQQLALYQGLDGRLQQLLSMCSPGGVIKQTYHDVSTCECSLIWYAPLHVRSAGHLIPESYSNMTKQCWIEESIIALLAWIFIVVVLLIITFMNVQRPLDILELLEDVFLPLLPRSSRGTSYRSLRWS